MPDEHTFADTGTRLYKRWEIIMPNGQRRCVYKALGATAAEMERMFPDAASVRPIG